MGAPRERRLRCPPHASAAGAAAIEKPPAPKETKQRKKKKTQFWLQKRFFSRERSCGRREQPPRGAGTAPPALAAPRALWLRTDSRCRGRVLLFRTRRCYSDSERKRNDEKTRGKTTVQRSRMLQSGVINRLGKGKNQEKTPNTKRQRHEHALTDLPRRCVGKINTG